jgi:hypothetical protein
MPLPVPNLDDRTFDQLVAEGRSLIPRYTAEWTNHNPSDPGITLVELFAYLAETAIFQLNRIPDESVESFLKLLGVCRKAATGRKEEIKETVGRALESVEQVNRAVTAADFEFIARSAAPKSGTRIARTAFVLYQDTACAPQSHTELVPVAELVVAEQAPVAALVVVVPESHYDPMPTPDTQLVATIFRRLKEHRLLTTRVHVVGPVYVEVIVTVTVVRKPNSGLTAVEVEQSVHDFLDPLRGGPEGKGWPFGRPVFYSELFQRLESMSKVDHVEELTLSTSPPGKLTPEGVNIEPDPITGQQLKPLALFLAEVIATVRD